MVEMTETANILHNATDREPGADGRDRPRHQHLRRPVAGLGGGAVHRRAHRRLHAVRHPLLRADRAGRANCPAASTCTSTRPSTATHLCSCTRSRTARPTRATGCRWPRWPACPAPSSARARSYLAELEQQAATTASPGPRPSSICGLHRPRSAARAARRHGPGPHVAARGAGRAVSAEEIVAAQELG